MFSPHVQAECAARFPNDAAAQQALLVATIAKADSTYDKLESDSRVSGRLFNQLTLFRGARVFRFDFAAKTMEQLWEFWRTHLLILPNWWCIAKRVGIMLSSSACAERLFAMYTSMFNAQQHACLEDRIEFAVTRKFNHNQRANMEEARLHA